MSPCQTPPGLQMPSALTRPALVYALANTHRVWSGRFFFPRPRPVWNRHTISLLSDHLSFRTDRIKLPHPSSDFALSSPHLTRYDICGKNCLLACHKAKFYIRTTHFNRKRGQQRIRVLQEGGRNTLIAILERQKYLKSGCDEFKVPRGTTEKPNLKTNRILLTLQSS